MSTYVFYEPNPLQQSFLREEDSFHATRVLRVKTGDKIHILDGKGHKYAAEITQVDAKRTLYNQIQLIQQSEKPAFQIHLYVAPTKQMERMEWMVEKCTEFGIHSIHFFHGRYSERKEIKLQRLEKTAIAALKQSKNLFLPQFHEIIPMSELMKKHQVKQKDQQYFFAHIADPADPILGKQIQLKQEYHILVGPEGDFSMEESNQLIAQDWIPFSLGQSILRTETAGIAVTHAIHLLHEIQA